MPLAAAAGMALAYVALCVVETIDLDYDQAANASAGAEFAIAWSFALCVLLLGGMAGVAARQPAIGRFGAARHQGVAAVAAFGALLAASWPIVLITVYVGPRVI